MNACYATQWSVVLLSIKPLVCKEQKDMILGSSGICSSCTWHMSWNHLGLPRWLHSGFWTVYYHKGTEVQWGEGVDITGGEWLWFSRLIFRQKDFLSISSVPVIDYASACMCWSSLAMYILTQFVLICFIFFAGIFWCVCLSVYVWVCFCVYMYFYLIWYDSV